MSGIYGIVNEIHHGIYVGSSLDIERRYHNHLKDLSNYRHVNDWLQMDYHLLGGAYVFRLEVLYEITTSSANLLLLENVFIGQYRNCYNLITDNIHNKYTRKWERRRNLQ